MKFPSQWQHGNLFEKKNDFAILYCNKMDVGIERSDWRNLDVLYLFLVAITKGIDCVIIRSEDTII